MRKILFLFTLLSLLLTACSAPVTALAATATPPPTATATLAPSATPLPSPTVKPSRTPPPTPTLPPGLDLACIPAGAERVSGRVSRVIDGDTINVKINGLTFTIRYLGIDTPETNKPNTPVQRFGPEAKARNRELVHGQYVTLIRDPNDEDTDRYDRLLRHVLVGDIFVNYTLVREGYARLFISGQSCGTEFFAAYEAAQADDVGLWAPTPDK